VHAERAAVEACVFQSAGHDGVGGDGKSVDGADEIAAVMAAGLVSLETGSAFFSEEAGEAFGEPGAVGLFSGEKDEQVGVATAEPGDEASGAEDDLGVGCAGQGSWSSFAVLCFGWDFRPV
jgi:hypothetical protein